MSPQQTTNRVLMIEPSQFGFNPETAATNFFMRSSTPLSLEEVRARACAEWQGLREKLQGKGVEVLAVLGHELPLAPETPDAVFPNNWFSTHETGELVLYPMSTPNRRAERRPEILERIRSRFRARRVVDLTSCEMQGHYLEGTGSLVLDRVHRVAYAGISSRMHEEALRGFERELGYRAIAFPIRDGMGREIYHTNVMMAVGRKLVVVCFEAIAGQAGRERVRASLAGSGHRVLEITLEQVNRFSGNVLELQSSKGAPLWVMSESARQGFAPEQLRVFQEEGEIVSADLSLIERLGGGSARCMMAELF